jgi:hypothetical protein
MTGNEAVVQKSKTWKRVNTYQQCPQLGYLLDAWVAAVERYTGHFPDNPWSYNERAILSTLAGAAWTIDGWVALEEFATSKRLRKLEAGVDHGDKLRKGRCDLFVSSPEASFVFEAKQANQPIGGRSDGCSYAYNAMGAAWDDIGDVQVEEADYRFAATFVVPMIPLGEIIPERGKQGDICAKKVEGFLKPWLEKTMGCLGKDAKYQDFAFVFPNLGDKNYVMRGRYYPGVVLLLKERRRATSRSVA